LLDGGVIFLERGSATQVYAAIFISIVFLLLDNSLRPYYDFRCNALKTLVSTSMVITLLCGLCSKLDPEGAVIGEGTLGWTLVIVNVVIVLLVLCLELIRRALSVVRGVRSGISYMKRTEAVSPSGAKVYEGELRLSVEDAVRSVVVTQYPTHAYPDARSVHTKLITLGETEHLCPVHALEVERGLLYIATSPYTTTLNEHIAKFQTCPTVVQDFASTMIEGLDQLHSMGIAHGNIQPETVLLDGSKLIISDFSRARLLEGDVLLAALVDDVKKAASTILFALSAGQATFEDILESAQKYFDDETDFDGVRAGKPELMDLLRTMVNPQVSLKSELLARPFFWSNMKIIEFLGEEVGSLLDPSATEQSNKTQHDFIVALEQKASAELGGEYDELRRQEGPSWSALMEMMNPDYPLGGARLLQAVISCVLRIHVQWARIAETGWGAGRMAQQAPADIEHDFAIYGKKPSPAQKETREWTLTTKGTVGKPAHRRTVGLLKMIRNMAFAHR
jgi:hypothetical protein